MWRSVCLALTVVGCWGLAFRMVNPRPTARRSLPKAGPTLERSSKSFCRVPMSPHGALRASFGSPSVIGHYRSGSPTKEKVQGHYAINSPTRFSPYFTVPGIKNSTTNTRQESRSLCQPPTPPTQPKKRRSTCARLARRRSHARQIAKPLVRVSPPR